MFILSQFVLRLSFGLALGMALTNPRQVTSGYYRNHLYVLLGLCVLATLVALGAPERFALAPPLIGAIASYVGSVLWLYEKPRPGVVSLLVVAAAALWGALDTTRWPSAAGVQTALAVLDPVSGGLVLGFTMAAMFLGHWYLNTPTMAIGPLERLIVLMAAAVALRGGVEAVNLALELADRGRPLTDQMLFIALRWLSGILGAMALAIMAYKTLKIPNTQSATGILYVAVIATFLGELVALLLSAGTA